MTAFEIVKRVIGVFVYPVAYYFREWPRKNKRFLWLWLDDSIVIDNINRGYLPMEYCGYGKREPLHFITEKMKDGKFKEFMRAWSWGAWRNNAINLATIFENYVGPVKYFIKRYGGDKSYYEIRRFKHMALPYMELRFLGFYFQCGWLKCGRFQVQFLKKA